MALLDYPQLWRNKSCHLAPKKQTLGGSSYLATAAKPPLCAESNGAIIDARTWGHLVVPTRAFALHPSTKEVDRGLSAADVCDIVQMRDGTVVNLYCWDHPVKGPIWCLSTSNDYDVSHLKWRGAKTYAELVHGLLLRHPAFVAETEMTLERNFLRKGDVRLGFGRLARTRCYTIGFRHGNFHPMVADPPAVWNIQSADLATGRPECGPGGGLPHVPHQVLYTRNDIASRRGAAVRMADLDYISRTALEDAKAIIAGWPAAGRCHFNYGFILRARDRSYPDVLCESPLLQRVRQLVYQLPSRSDLVGVPYLEYNAMKAFLTATDRSDFLALFPGLAPALRFTKSS